jgi:hypothetical protein
MPILRPLSKLMSEKRFPKIHGPVNLSLVLCPVHDSRSLTHFHLEAEMLIRRNLKYLQTYHAASCTEAPVGDLSGDTSCLESYVSDASCTSCVGESHDVSARHCKRGRSGRLDRPTPRLPRTLTAVALQNEDFTTVVVSLCFHSDTV